MYNPGPIILFDGVCNLCNGAVQFVIKRDKKNVFKFASLDSQTAKSYFTALNISSEDSMVLIEDGKFYKKSSAVLRIAKHLKGAWPLLSGFLIIPQFIRDAFYTLLARNRYKWFGKANECMIPTSALQARFLR